VESFLIWKGFHIYILHFQGSDRNESQADDVNDDHSVSLADDGVVIASQFLLAKALRAHTTS
jgi:hypothetical protein